MSTEPGESLIGIRRILKGIIALMVLSALYAVLASEDQSNPIVHFFSELGICGGIVLVGCAVALLTTITAFIYYLDTGEAKTMDSATLLGGSAFVSFCVSMILGVLVLAFGSFSSPLSNFVFGLALIFFGLALWRLSILSSEEHDGEIAAAVTRILMIISFLASLYFILSIFWV